MDIMQVEVNFNIQYIGLFLLLRQRRALMLFQVQLLVTSQDVENYKQIKSDLDQLRSIVEKSELWVYKRQGSDEGMDAGETLSAEPEHKMVQYIVHQKLFDVVYKWFY